MRVLWFTNTPCGALHYFKQDLVRGGWLTSLESELKRHENVELGVAFFHDKGIEPFQYNGTQYFPIQRQNKTKLKRFFSRILSKVEKYNHLKDFKQVCQIFNPDIIHIHGTENTFGYVQKETAKPVVISIQGNFTVYSRFYFRGLNRRLAFVTAGIKKNVLAIGPVSQQKIMEKKSVVERDILSGSKFVLGRTAWDKQIANVLAPDAIYFRGEEMLRPSFYKMEWNSSTLKNNQLYTTCGENWYKGVESIFETAIILKNFGLPFTWKVAGVKANSQIVRASIKKFKNTPQGLNIEFIGNRNEMELANDLASHSIYIQTSHIENSPNSLCEAMLVGIPLISTLAGGSHSLFEHDKEGVLIQDGDAYAIAGAIIELLKNETYCLKLSQNARSRATERHNKNKITTDLVLTYKKIVELNV